MNSNSLNSEMKIRNQSKEHAPPTDRTFLQRSVKRTAFVSQRRRLDFRRSLVSGLRPSPSGEECGLLSRTVAGDRAYQRRC